MRTAIKNNKNDGLELVGAYFFERLWEESWIYIKTVVDVVREPVLVLDKNFRVLAGNEPFYKTFQTEAKDTDGRILYELGNGQWNIPELRKLLETVLPKHTFFKGFEVTHEFPLIGRKTILLNARQVHFKAGENASKLYPPIILLAMEDITEMMDVADMLARHANQFENKMSETTNRLESKIKDLEKEVRELKK